MVLGLGFDIGQHSVAISNHSVSKLIFISLVIYIHQVPLPTNELVSYNTYAPSKFAITALNEVLRHELTWAKNEKIRVSSLSPGKRNVGKTAAIETINQIDWQ